MEDVWVQIVGYFGPGAVHLVNMIHLSWVAKWLEKIISINYMKTHFGTPPYDKHIILNGYSIDMYEILKKNIKIGDSCETRRYMKYGLILRDVCLLNGDILGASYLTIADMIPIVISITFDNIRVLQWDNYNFIFEGSTLTRVYCEFLYGYRITYKFDISEGIITKTSVKGLSSPITDLEYNEMIRDLYRLMKIVNREYPYAKTLIENYVCI